MPIRKFKGKFRQTRRSLWKKSRALQGAKSLHEIRMKKSFPREGNGVHSSWTWHWALPSHMTVRGTTCSSRTMWNMCLELPHWSVEREWKCLVSEISPLHLKLLKLTHFHFSVYSQEVAKVNRCIRTCTQTFTAALSTTTQSKKTKTKTNAHQSINKTQYIYTQWDTIWQQKEMKSWYGFPHEDA